MARDSMNKKKAIPGSRKETGLSNRLARLIALTVSAMNQTTVIAGVKKSRNNRVVNPASVRLKPNSKSNLAPRMRRMIN
jgi:hypothetical protein